MLFVSFACHNKAVGLSRGYARSLLVVLAEIFLALHVMRLAR
jgi:hypothetical protein